ncbi:MAG: sel1 repeat family protein [Magnetococcales bacterium]|nr:sel1 repeat family protein [Magnetococcales bacterium]
MKPLPSQLPISASAPGLHAIDEEEYFNALLTMAEWGDPKAQHTLGAMYLQGEEVGVDYAEALGWHRKAAEQGFAAAQHDLGTMYLEGLGTTPDPEAAAHWFLLAARQGDAKARNNLGILFATGEGVPLDRVRAHAWFSLAIAGGMDEAIENRQIAEEEMTPEEIGRAVALAESWTEGGT